MPAPPRPKRFQIHLSTAIATIVTGTALVLLNVSKNSRSVPDPTHPHESAYHARIEEYGWPTSFFELRNKSLEEEFKRELSQGKAYDPGPAFYPDHRTSYFSMAICLLAACAILISVFAVFEGLARLRQARSWRERCQFHLGTAVFLTIAAGLLLWANVRVGQTDSFLYYVRGEGDYGCTANYFGWPFEAVEYFTGYHLETKIFWIPLGLNVAISFAILLLVWSASESLIRRRAARKAP